MTPAALVNLTLSLLLVVGGGIGAVVATRPASLLRSAARRSDDTGLPLGSPDIVDAVVARARTFARATGATLVVAGIVAAAVSLGPLGDERGFVPAVIALALVAIAASVTVATVVTRPFRPTGDAPRIARATVRRTADYLGPTRRLLPWVLTVGAAILAAVLLVRGEAGGVGLALTAVAVVGACLLPLVDRAVVTAPQSASHSLELAWDESFRADTMGAARATVCLLALTGTVLILPIDIRSTALAINVAMTAVALFYARAPFSAALMPPWLAAVGQAARR